MIFLLAFLASFCHAQVFDGVMSSGVGGSGRAGLDANEGVFLNPALVALLPESSADGYFKDGYADRGQFRHAVGASISEAEQDAPVSGSLSYLQFRNTGTAPTPENSNVVHLTFGSLLFKRLAVGISGYRFYASPEHIKSSEQINAALGAVFLVAPGFGIAYVYDNPFRASNAIPLGLRLLPQQSIGLFYLTPYSMRLRLDLVHQDHSNRANQFDTRFGIETQVQPYMSVRLGARFDEYENERYVTAGLSFLGPRLKLDYSFEKNIARTNGAVHGVDLRTTF